MPRWGMNHIEQFTMPQSLSNILIHLIWSTKDRHPWLEPGIREKTHAFLAGAVRQCDCEAYRVGGVADHVHLAVRLSRTLSVADLVKEVKTASSKWLKTQDPAYGDFFWQQGYGVFSVGMSQKETLLDYILKVKPKTTFLVHGDPRACEWFKTELKTKLPSTEAIVPEPGRDYQLT